ncbi:hypothetical protein [Solwaraspora sp. WMMA2080]|uniref:MmyB family transcriptional regulator n=1 Tax=Solwaraspora sp. WMMA2080 TaxID=3015165 RepID=UPI0032B30760
MRPRRSRPHRAAATLARHTGDRAEPVRRCARLHRPGAGDPSEPDTRPESRETTFLDPAERALFPDWEEQARQGVAWLRADADPGSPRLAALVGELTLKSPDFVRLWARHDVRVKSAGRKRFAHPVVGEFAVNFETFQVNGKAGQTLTVYHTAPGTSDADALTLLASHAATASTDRVDAPRDVVVVDRPR